MPRLQDLPDISSKITKDDKVVIVRNNSQGLASLNNIKKYMKPNYEEENSEE